jgi:hypothetical protein
MNIIFRPCLYGMSLEASYWQVLYGTYLMCVCGSNGCEEGNMLRSRWCNVWYCWSFTMKLLLRTNYRRWCDYGRDSAECDRWW